MKSILKKLISSASEIFNPKFQVHQSAEANAYLEYICVPFVPDFALQIVSSFLLTDAQWDLSRWTSLVLWVKYLANSKVWFKDET